MDCISVLCSMAKSPCHLGVSYLSWSTNEIFLECYANSSPIEDELHFLFKKAWAVSSKMLRQWPQE